MLFDWLYNMLAGILNWLASLLPVGGAIATSVGATCDRSDAISTAASCAGNGPGMSMIETIGQWAGNLTYYVNLLPLIVFLQLMFAVLIWFIQWKITIYLYRLVPVFGGH